jgi:hypothetical protein
MFLNARVDTLGQSNLRDLKKAPSKLTQEEVLVHSQLCFQIVCHTEVEPSNI